MSKIARRVYKDVSLWPEIARANKLAPPYNIFTGQELIIPNSCQAGTLFSANPRSSAVNPGTGSGSTLGPVTPPTVKPSKPAPPDLFPFIEADRVLLPEWTIEETYESVYDSGPVVVKLELTLRLNFKPGKP